MKAAGQAPPREGGIGLAHGHWKVVREFVERRFGGRLGRRSCLTYLHRLGFVLKRPKKRLTKADAAKRQDCVTLYAELRREAERTGATMWFVDEALCRAAAALRGSWVLKGAPALVESSSPSLKEKVVYDAAVCLETGEVAEMEVDGNCTAATSVAFLRHLRTKPPEPVIIRWDKGPAHRGAPLRSDLAPPALNLRLVPWPGYSPDYKADEASWDWLREDVTAHTCLGPKAVRTLARFCMA